MTPVELSRTVLCAVRRAVDVGELSVSVPARAVVTPPGPGGRGDYASSIALQLARPAGRTPLKVAEVLRAHLLAEPGITDVVVTGPGFLNISLQGTAPAVLVAEILRLGPLRYGFAAAPTGQFDVLDAPTGQLDTLAAPTGQLDPLATPTGQLDPLEAPTGQPDALAAPPGQLDALAAPTGQLDPLEAPTGQLDAPAAPPTRLVHLHAPREVRAVAVADVSARLLRSQGVLVRTSCVARPEASWTDDLGLEVDVSCTPESPSPFPVNVLPVPAPADPVPLGRDAARWALLHPAAHDRPRIGDEHLVQRESNPLFRVRYAHARTRALSRNARDLGFAAEPGPTPEAGALLAALADHPRILGAAARHRAPDRLARHLVTVADAALPFLLTVLPCGEEKPSAAHRARLALAEATGTVLAGGLTLLGIDAPDHL
ncbi:DALR anticodon-binding domain-containing protein [Streptomyces sp. NBC_00289]|uniref:ArgS-related anticodon-binding protein NrtL n=1 Tax=Streptomyces sp. NBC_00289 TaxID=2975703 RepID=UPI003244B901